MKTYTTEELKTILDNHWLWIEGNGGQRANLSGANLSRADLSGAYLSRADLSGADLSGANLSRANLSGANLSRANLSRANLSRADLSVAYLSGADLSGADLSGVYLSGANLSGADLSGADLSGAVHAWAQVAFMGHGEMGRMLTAVIFKEGDPITLQCGCFYGSEKELKDYIANGEEQYKKSRTLAMRTAIKLIKEPKA